MHKASILNSNDSVLLSVEGPVGLSVLSSETTGSFEKRNLILLIVSQKASLGIVDSALVSGNERVTHDL